MYDKCNLSDFNVTEWPCGENQCYIERDPTESNVILTGIWNGNSWQCILHTLQNLTEIKVTLKGTSVNSIYLVGFSM
jgi:hypothetical protein